MWGALLSPITVSSFTVDKNSLTYMVLLHFWEEKVQNQNTEIICQSSQEGLTQIWIQIKWTPDSILIIVPLCYLSPSREENHAFAILQMFHVKLLSAFVLTILSSWKASLPNPHWAAFFSWCRWQFICPFL